MSSNTEVEILGPSTDRDVANPLADSDSARALVTTTTDRKLRLRRIDLINQPPAVRKDGGLRSQRGSGSVYKPSWTDRRTGQRREGKTWWVSFYVGVGGGKKRVRIDTKETEYKNARKRLTEEQARAHINGGKDPRDASRVKFDALGEAVLRRYAEKRFRSVRRVQISLTHLTEFFAEHRITDIDQGAVERYKDHRLGQGAAPASVNRELSTLKLGFGLLERKLKVNLKPYIELLAEDNIRQGFVVQAEIDRLLQHLPPHIAPAIECAYLTGWRLCSELLSRTRDDVIDLDNENAHLFLDAFHSKNGKPRRFYFNAIPRLREIIESQIAAADALELKIGRPVPHLFFQPPGGRIRNLRRRWRSATKAAGLEGLIPHDLRRSAVKNLNDAGIPRELAKLFTGHRSDAVYSRYSLESDESLKMAAAKLGAHLTKRANVVPLKKTGTE